MNKTIYSLVFALFLLPLYAQAQSDDSVSTDIVVAAEDVPQAVMQAAKDAKPSAYIMRITRRQSWDDQTYYDFNASQVGKYWMIRVRADGKLVSVGEESDPPVLSTDD